MLIGLGGTAKEKAAARPHIPALKDETESLLFMQSAACTRVITRRVGGMLGQLWSERTRGLQQCQ